ncbi:MAG: glycosyl hydrolase family 28-related protein [Candidatus Marinimicrobia bacterium]|nr:glycosyl hydrolase family 28-related protein [Candidatus Neomarinimicrobiota bacterium]
MKLTIVIMALLLMSVGVGSAVNRMPATEFMGDIDFASGFYARNATEGIFNVKDYGAVGDGTTDDAPAIQTTIDAAAAAGGGIIYAPPGTYYLNSSQHEDDSRILLSPLNNTFLVGSGIGVTIFKLGDNYRAAHSGAYMYFTDTDEFTENFGVSGITWDGNGENNLIVNGSLPGANAAICNEWSGIGAANARNVVITNCEFVNWTGVWCIALFGMSRYPDWSENAIVENNIIRNNSDAIAGNDHRDFAAMNIGVDNTIVRNNIIAPTVGLTGPASSIEIHCPNAIVANNIIKNMQSGIYITPYNNIDGVDSSVVVTGNTLINLSSAGIAVWGMPGKRSGVISILENNIDMYKGGVGIGHGQSSDVFPTDALPTKLLKIDGNSITFRNTDGDGRGIHTNMTEHLDISNNNIHGSGYMGIYVIDGCKIESLNIVRNSIIDCGTSGTSYWLRGILVVFTYSGGMGSIDENTIWNDTEMMPVNGIFVIFGAGKTVDLRIEKNRINPDITNTINTQGTPSGSIVIIDDGASPPTVGYRSIGSIRYNTSPAANGTMGWVCTAAGYPGTWKTWGAIAA